MTDYPPDRLRLIQKIEANREDLETLAESDLDCAWMAQALLEMAGDERYE